MADPKQFNLAEFAREVAVTRSIWRGEGIPTTGVSFADAKKQSDAPPVPQPPPPLPPPQAVRSEVPWWAPWLFAGVVVGAALWATSGEG